VALNTIKQTKKNCWQCGLW